MLTLLFLSAGMEPFSAPPQMLLEKKKQLLELTAIRIRKSLDFFYKIDDASNFLGFCRSEGSLCLPRRWYKDIPGIVQRLVSGKYRFVRIFCPLPPFPFLTIG